ncbi:MAG: alpha-amylase family glycosyl hydrolase [Bacteroidales bacterium]|nr:alpha-amylase family glycosyl hydrolase [Bacteroidales bacterium]
MKKHIYLFLLFIALSASAWAQITTSTPQFITQSAGAIDIIYDASLGTAGLKNYAGTDVYAHAGVITTASTSNTDWKHAPAWLDNSAKYKLTSLGNNKWKFSITPSIDVFYGLTSGEKVTKLAFVFRNGTGSLQGKDTGGADILVDVFQDGLNVAFTNPTSAQSVSVGTNMNIQVGSSVAANLNLLINGASVKTATAATTLSFSYTFATAADYTLIAEATAGGVTVRDTALVCVPAPVTNQSVPAGMKEGINYINNTTATLVLRAPGKTNVFLLGDFNNWVQQNAYQLKRDGDLWWITLSDLTPSKLYGFQYLVDGTIRSSDPYTELVLDPWNDKWINQYNNIFPNLKAYPVGKTDGLVATLQTAKPTYNWIIPNFTTPALENMVIYEMLFRDFTPQKSIDAAIAKLDYLKTLGITAVELMPIQEFDGNNSWGYNPNHYFAPDKAYGTPDKYKLFIDECHKRGIAVILDVVFNHASGINPFALLYWDGANNRPASNNPWMNTTAPHPYSVLNDFNHSSSYTKDYFKRVVQYWLSEYKVDGYRLDLTKGFTQTSSTESNASNYDQARIDNLSAYYDAAKSVKSDVMFILEHFCNNDEETALANKGMFLWRKVNNEFSQSAMGYQASSDFGAMNSFPRRWVGFAESHDEERNFFKAKTYGTGNLKTDSLARFKRIPLNVAFATLMPGPKMMWEFQEMGYDYSIDSNGGRTNEKPSVWQWLDIPARKAAYEACSKVISLRRDYPNAFTQGNFALNVGSGDWSAGRRIALTHSDLNMVVLGNFDASASAATNPNFPNTGLWYNVLTGQDYYVGNTSTTIVLQPGELAVFTDRKPNGIKDVVTDKDCTVYPTMTNGKVYVSSSSRIEHIDIYNLQGAKINSLIESSNVDFSGYTKGIYLMEVSTSSSKSIHKIIKN